MNKKIGLGIMEVDGRVFLFRKSSNVKKSFEIDYSLDGHSFHLYEKKARIKRYKKPLDISNLTDFRISKVGNLYFTIYRKEINNHYKLFSAFSKDLSEWKNLSGILKKKDVSVLYPGFVKKNKYLVCFGGKSITLATSPDFKKWQRSKLVIYKLSASERKKFSIIAGNIIPTYDGFLILFFVMGKKKNSKLQELRAILVDDDLKTVVWSKPKTIWKRASEWSNENIYPLGVVEVSGMIISYWEGEGGNIYAVNHPNIMEVLSLPGEGYAHPQLDKHGKNPILKPDKKNEWENFAVFNPAAWYDKGKVHLIYRAVGSPNSSVWGYASSKDGVNIDDRQCPVYTPSGDFEVNRGNSSSLEFMSAGAGWAGGGGGCEDPRIVKIDDKFYVTYVAYDGRTPPRLAITSINATDFHNKNWSKWTKPTLISKPGEINKQGSILPEKYKGKYVIFHRVFPNILVDFVDSLDFDGKTFLKGEYNIATRDDNWDSRKVGVGATPIKTKYGWLVIYNAVDDKDDRHYKLGAMILDKNNPLRVLYRSNNPILEPTEHYENYGLKYGIVYACGAVVMNNMLMVYYGGSDMTVNVAYRPLNQFLDEIKFTGASSLKVYGGTN